jgi:hypothetical protein
MAGQSFPSSVLPEYERILWYLQGDNDRYKTWFRSSQSLGRTIKATSTNCMTECVSGEFSPEMFCGIAFFHHGQIPVKNQKQILFSFQLSSSHLSSCFRSHSNVFWYLSFSKTNESVSRGTDFIIEIWSRMCYSRVMREWQFITFQISSFFLLVIPLMGRSFDHPPNLEQVHAQSITFQNLFVSQSSGE